MANEKRKPAKIADERENSRDLIFPLPSTPAYGLAPDGRMMSVIVFASFLTFPARAERGGDPGRGDDDLESIDRVYAAAEGLRRAAS